jgi:TonB-linked SusC/RagA family outer membrane protein
LPGVNIIIKGTKVGTTTNFDGTYSIKTKVGETLVFSFLGMKELSIIVGESNSINPRMSAGVEQIGEVVIQANFGYLKKDAKKLSSSVSVITAEEITRQAPTMTVNNALQGQAAGVQVTNNNGKPGAGAFVTVRGAVSITGGNAGATYVVDGAFVNATEASSIQGSDVESVSVLKDGAAASLYGVRGANGVVVITTKRGKSGNPKFEFNNSVGYSQKIKDRFDMMNAEQKIEYERQIGAGPSFGKTPAEIELLKSYQTDWQETLLKKGYIQNNTFSYTGGNDKGTNYLSLGYTENEGIVKNIDGFNRISARYNSEIVANNAIKFGWNISGSYEKFNEIRDRNNAQNPFRAIYDYNSYEPLYLRDASGNILYNENGPRFNTAVAGGFPIAEAIVNNPEQQRFFRVYGRPYIDIKLFKNFTYTSKINLNYERFQREVFIKPNSFLDNITGDLTAKGQKTDNGHDFFDYQFTNSINYKYNIGDNNHFDTTLLYEFSKSNLKAYNIVRKGYVSGDLPTAGTAVVGLPFTTRTENSTISIFGNIDYDYKNKYIISLYGRRDGSSLLGANNKYEFAKGISVGWALSEESFLKDNSWLNNLKLRASYGELNSTSGITNNYAAQSLFSTAPYANSVGYVINRSTLGNPDLKFEKAKKSEIGLEAALFKNWLTFSSSYFSDKRSDFIYSDNTTIGTNLTYFLNAGDWTSKGYELELKAFVIKNQNTKLSFYVNGAAFDRKINKLNRPEDPNNQLIRDITINKVGYQPDEFYLVPYAGVDPKNGHALYTKLDGSTTDVFSNNDRVLTGKTPYAKYEGGFGFQFSHKGFDLSTDFVFKQGNYTYNFAWSDVNADGASPTRNQAVNAFDFWTPTNTGATQPAPRLLSGINSNQTSDRFLEDASYVRFRNLNFGYTFDKKYFPNFPLDQVRLYAQIQNLFTWTKFNGDPEVGIGSGENQGTTTLPRQSDAIPGQYAQYSYPTLQTFLFGLTINL